MSDLITLPVSGDLELVRELSRMGSLLERIADSVSRGEDWGSIDRTDLAAWPDGGTYELDLNRRVPGIGVYNRSRVTAYVATTPNRGTVADGEFKVPGGSWRTFPIRTSWVSIGGPGAGSCEVVTFAVPPAFDGGAIPERAPIVTNRIEVAGAATTPIVGAQGIGYAIRVTAFGITLPAGATGEFRSGGNNLAGALLDPGLSISGTANDPVLVCGENEALNLVTVGGGAHGFVDWFAEPV